MNRSERTMGLGLRGLRRLASSRALDRMGIRRHAERVVYGATKTGFRSAAAASRTFKAAEKLGKPARQPQAHNSGLFDLTPTDEQQMLVEAIGAFGAEQVRPAASEANEVAGSPAELLTQAQELGVSMLGIPEELGGVMSERSAVTSVLVTEALGHADMGIALAALAPGAVATAIGLWGDAEQQATYLPAFTGEDVPAAALALLEPRALFDPLSLQTTARREGGDWLLNGVKSLVPGAAKCELFILAADAEGLGPALFLIESSTSGLSTEAEPAMGLRAAATGRLVLEDVRLPAQALLAQGENEAYRECVQRARIGWCALAVGTCSGSARLCDPLRQRPYGIRRADLQPSGGRLRRGRHRHRARRHAPEHLPGGEPRGRREAVRA